MKIRQSPHRAYSVIAGNLKGLWNTAETNDNPRLLGDNAPETQNFKIIGWDAIQKALRMR